MIKVGDVVTWQPKPRPTIQPLGIRGVTVLELGETEDGKPAALVDAGYPFGKIGVLVEDLHKESKP